MKLFEGQEVIDNETGLPMTPERKEEVRNRLLAEGIKVVIAPDAEQQLKIDGVSLEQVHAQIWEHLGGKKS